ncbi:ABC-three component system protein [Acinetobacter sp. NIPH 2699]|uniref:ABC-three component system protein n=1 Tax=Acinetobacter sp. NIPH 2699 TaxID=2923433 RepID=UPI001F4A9DAC|nr:ABC-three component system protein [Acinetobacter sp. NIPH 2699]MCH7337107.1 hypothetical protein [Acinetobacter sp. NIPH 2699]
MTSQKDIQAGGDVAAGDINKSTYHFHGDDSAIFTHPYFQLVSAIQAGHEIDIEEQIEDLEHFSGMLREDQRGLEKKLIDSNRGYLVNSAERFKSKAGRLIAKHQDSPAFQFLIAKILARIEVTFNHIISPMIQNNASIQEVEAAILKEVIQPIERLLIGTPLGSNNDCVVQLFYFLAGNCHICWDKKC